MADARTLLAELVMLPLGGLVGGSHRPTDGLS